MSKLTDNQRINALASFGALCQVYAENLGLEVIIRQHAVPDETFKEADATNIFSSQFSKGVHWLTCRPTPNVTITLFKDRPKAVPDEYEFPTLTEDTPHVLDELEHHVR